MKKIISDKLPRIIKNKKKLEKDLDVKISNRGKEVYIQGSAEDEFIAEQVIDAINFGFSILASVSIKTEDMELETINIKDYARGKDFKRVIGRIIGKDGRALQTLTQLTNCYFEVKENEVGIIGYPEDIRNARESIMMLARGSKHGNVYARLEKNHPKPITDWGLKKQKRKK